MAEKFLIFAFIGLCSTAYAIAATAAKPNQCYTCRGINCLRTSVQEVIETCINDLDVCVTIFDKFAVAAKGCLQNMPVEFRGKCNDRTNPECQVCTEGLCNKFGRKDFKCYECNGKDDSNCLNNVSALTPVQCKIPTSPNSYCFTDSRNGQVTRGCSLHVKEQKACLASEACALCSVEFGQGCNGLSTEIRSGGFKNTAAMGLVVLCASVARMVLTF